MLRGDKVLRRRAAGGRGLTRAYTKGAKDALAAVGISTMSLWTLWDVPCTYPSSSG